MTLHYDIAEIIPYINWDYFFFAWQLKEEGQQENMRHEAERFLGERIVGRYRTHAIVLIEDTHSDGDDIVLTSGQEMRLPMLRQQHQGVCLSLADFISPTTDCIGLFATSADIGLETDFDSDPYEKMMAQLLADRLAEATAEKMHEEVRKNYWGYAPDENLSMNDLHAERFVGIRPAVGYPSLPDASLNFLLNERLDMKQIGISLTPSGAMRPHASVSGLMIAHPKAHYFSIGKIGEDQLSDYARRRNIPVVMARKFLAGNLH